MSTELSPAPSEATPLPWGKLNPKRGATYEDHARAFVKEFPIGTSLTNREFDVWAEARGLLYVPMNVNKQSNDWMAHLQRRHRVRYALSKASTLPTIDPPFIVEGEGDNTLLVKSPLSVVKTNNRMLDRLVSLLRTKKKQLDYLIQSIDFESLPEFERLFALTLYDDLDGFQENLELQSRRLSNKFARLEHDLRLAVEQGKIVPKNHGIKAIIDDSQTVDDDHEPAAI